MSGEAYGLVEEKQMDESKMKEAFQALRKQDDADKEVEQLLENKLASVMISKDDVALVAQKMEISTQQADRKLLEAADDVVKFDERRVVVGGGTAKGLLHSSMAATQWG